MLKKYIFEEKIEDSPSTTSYHFKASEVLPERYGWGVTYKDGSELKQFDDVTGKFHQFREIDMPNVHLFIMYKLDDPKKRYDVCVDDNIQIFHFYRNIKLWYKEGFDFERIYVFGIKFKNSSNAIYHFILPDDRMVMSHFDNVDLSKFEI